MRSLLEQSAGCSMGFRKVAGVDQDKYPHGKPELPMVVASMAGPRSGHRKPVKAGPCLLRIPPVAFCVASQRAWGTRSGSFFILGSFGRKQRARSVRGASFPWPVSLLMTEVMVESSFSNLIPGRNTDHSGQEARLKFHESHENRTRRRRHGL